MDTIPLVGYVIFANSLFNELIKKEHIHRFANLLNISYLYIESISGINSSMYCITYLNARPYLTLISQAFLLIKSIFSVAITKRTMH